MTDDEVREAVGKLDAVSSRDPERAHLEADDLLLAIAPAEVRDAYHRLVDRCNWWACA